METLSNISKDHLMSICDTHYVDKLYLFGSRSKNTAKKDSDYDFLVRFKRIDLKDYFSNFISFKEQLEKLFNTDIDLIEEQALKNPILIESIEKDKILIYG